MQKKPTAPAPAKSAQKAAGSTTAKSAAPPSRAAEKKSQPVKAAAKVTSAKVTGSQVTGSQVTGSKVTGSQATESKGPARTSAKASGAKGHSGGGSATVQVHTPAPATVAKSAAAKAAKEVPKTVVAKKAEAPAAKKPAAAPRAKVKGDRAAFFAQQRELLLEERREYTSSAEALKAQADSLALEHEPGDVQFDEEGGEGGTANVDREIDLYLSAQARATVVEIDRALQKIEDGTYGVCEQCGEMIPEPRLQALPYAALCVTCKSGGLRSRR